MPKALPEAAALLIAALLGSVSIFGFAQFYLFFVPILTVAVLLFFLIRTDNALQAFLLGFFFGAGMFLTGTNWIFISLHNFGNLAIFTAATVTIAFCLFLAIFPGLQSLIFFKI